MQEVDVNRGGRPRLVGDCEREVQLGGLVDGDHIGCDRRCGPHRFILTKGAYREHRRQFQFVRCVAAVGDVEQVADGFSRAGGVGHRTNGFNHPLVTLRCLNGHDDGADDVFSTQRCPREGEVERLEGGDFRGENHVHRTDAGGEGAERLLRVKEGEVDLVRGARLRRGGCGCQLKRVFTVPWIGEEHQEPMRLADVQRHRCAGGGGCGFNQRNV